MLVRSKSKENGACFLLLLRILESVLTASRPSRNATQHWSNYSIWPSVDFSCSWINVNSTNRATLAHLQGGYIKPKPKDIRTMPTNIRFNNISSAIAKTNDFATEDTTFPQSIQLQPY